LQKKETNFHQSVPQLPKEDERDCFLPSLQHFTYQGVRKVFYQVKTYLEKLAKRDEFEKVIQQFPKETETDCF